MRAASPTARAVVTASVVVLAAACAPGGADPAPTAGHLLAAKGPDGHRLRQLPPDQAPRVALDVQRDSESGWNLHVTTERFRFTPEHVGGKARSGEGHAHLYLDGEKIARLYAPWFHLSGSRVPPGRHTLTVGLNANDHTAWAVNGGGVRDGAPISSSGGEQHTRHGHGHGHG